MEPHELEALIKKQLEVFHQRRLQALSKLELRTTLRKKNPYLFRAIDWAKLVRFNSGSGKGES